MSGQPEEALDVLRGVWSAQGQDAADLGGDGEVKACKRMANVGFGAPGDDAGLRTAWQERLEREGKRSAFGGSVADLVFGRAELPGETPAGSPPEAR